MSKIEGKVAFVTGANRGIGRSFVEELLEAGAAKIYAGARNPESLVDLITSSGGKIEPLELDVTKMDLVEKAAAASQDVSLLINNAGIAGFKGLIAAETTSLAQAEMDVNYFGTLNMIRAFAPVLATNGGGAIVNMSSILGQVNIPLLGSYCAAKAAVHSLTQGVRAELVAQGTQVVGVYPGPVDTDMGTLFPMDKAAPSAVVKAVLDGLEKGEEDIFPDPASKQLHAGLLGDPKAVEKRMATMLGGT